MVKKKLKKIAAPLCLLMTFCAILFVDVVSAKESLQRLINRLNKDYTSINETLKELEDTIRFFPNTSLTVSVTNNEQDIDIVSIEVWKNINLLQSHIYTSLDNRAMRAGSRHELYEKEIKEGYHVLKIVYFWLGADKAKTPIKGEAFVNLSITTGKNYLLQIDFKKRETILDLRYSMHIFKYR